MEFQDQVIASFMGTFFGFVFAIILFFVTNYIKGLYIRKNLIKHLKREFKYDSTLLEGWIKEVDRILLKITGDDVKVYSYIRYTDFQRSFIREAFRSGILYDKLDNDEISQLNNILLHCDFGSQQIINDSIVQWQDKQIDKGDALEKFDFEKGQLEKYKKQLKHLLGKL